MEPFHATRSLAMFLIRHGVFNEGTSLRFESLAGGVSSDIWLVTDADRQVVVKTPLASLRVADDWQAPVARSASEAAWLRVAAALVPGVCPEVLAYDETQHLLALTYLDPITHALWKDDLLAGRVDEQTAAHVGDRIGTVHRLTSARPGLAVDFATDDLFRTLRMEPYLERLVDRHPDLRDPLEDLVATTMSTRLALVHGDLSPKNILVGGGGPVFLDAETAWWGDPAFDVAFCLNHLLLKSLLPTTSVGRLVDAFHAFVDAYVPHIVWEPSDVLLARATRLLPALLLARVDGRSPVEYLVDDARVLVREFARPRIPRPRDELVDLTREWKAALS